MIYSSILRFKKVKICVLCLLEIFLLNFYL